MSRDAMQFTDATKDQCFNFVTCNHYASWDDDGNPTMVIQTPYGESTVTTGDWILREGDGVFYVAKFFYPPPEKSRDENK